MAGAFSAGLSGLNANAEYLSVIANNLANINTVGFKSSSVTFQDLVSQNASGTGPNPMQIGLGVVTGSITTVFSQGAIENTREGTNVAIQGNGLFVVRGSSGVAYTRAGAFSFNSEGKLITADGAFVQGYSATDPITGAIVTTGTPTDIAVPTGVLRTPVATTAFSTLTNLNANAVAGDIFTTTVQVYDALGASHVATLNYTKGAAAGEWTYAMTVPGAEVVGGTPGVPFPLPGAGAGTIVFDALGQLATVNGAAPADVVLTTPAWTNGAAASALTWNLVDANNRPSLTGFAMRSDTTSKSQNGSAAGMFSDLSISSDGSIMATFGAGQSVAVGQLAMATFNNLKGLVKLGSNQYGEGQASGLPNVGVAGSAGRGTLIGSALELSNVDIATEFTHMILAQRGYQANSKTITVSDEILLDTLGLKR